MSSDMGRRWRFRFEWTRQFSPTWNYMVVGAYGGLNLHISDYGEKFAQDHGHQYSGGLEMHSRTPLYDETPPDHAPCWLLHCPCWHDGTSAYVSEHVIPMWIGRRWDMDYWHSWLANEADKRFAGQRARGDTREKE